MTEPDERDEIAGVLAEVAREHPIECSSRYEGYTCRGCRDRGWMSPFDYRRHVAEAQATHLATILAERDRRTAARAVREAADHARWPNLGSEPGNGYTSARSVRRWLRERADEIADGRR